ncbi:MAG: hypothetical protein JSR91_00295 [Proteobacteria bacterium]|nr:hypothetical protein [Pseudomonadota bacterium]
MMMDHLPSIPVPADADLRHYTSMPLDVQRLRDSGIAGTGDAEIFRCAVLLWCAAWHQIPAGSLPSDDPSLARLAGLGRDLKGWAKIKSGAMRGFRLFADERLYHPVVSEKVVEAWNSTRTHDWQRACDRLRKENAQRRKTNLKELLLPPKPSPCHLMWPEEFPGNSPRIAAGIPLENDLKGREGKGILSSSSDTESDPAREAQRAERTPRAQTVTEVVKRFAESKKLNAI